MKTLWRIWLTSLIAIGGACLNFSCTQYTIEIPSRDPLLPGPVDEISSNCDPDTVYFINTIQPLVVSSCATTGCHDENGHREGVILTDYHSIITTGKISAGNPGKGKFMESLTANGEDRMPPRPLDPLGTEEISLIEKWIRQGALNNRCSVGCDTTSATFSGEIWPMMELYCTNCHKAGSSAGGVMISGYDDLVALAQNGSLMGSVTWDPSYANMPPNAMLSDCSIALLEKWIENGFPQ
jgi:hypothetical protein